METLSDGGTMEALGISPPAKPVLLGSSPLATAMRSPRTTLAVGRAPAPRPWKNRDPEDSLSTRTAL